MVDALHAWPERPAFAGHQILLEQGETERLVIDAEDNLVAELVTEVVVGQLAIRTRPDIELDPTRPIIYRVTLTQALEAVSERLI